MTDTTKTGARPLSYRLRMGMHGDRYWDLRKRGMDNAARRVLADMEAEKPDPIPVPGLLSRRFGWSRSDYREGLWTSTAQGGWEDLDAQLEHAEPGAWRLYHPATDGALRAVWVADSHRAILTYCERDLSLLVGDDTAGHNSNLDQMRAFYFQEAY